ncbi:MAG TPA: hypothetical protein VGC24_08980 [Burkholderiaceae bacterium]
MKVQSVVHQRTRPPLAVALLVAAVLLAHLALLSGVRLPRLAPPVAETRAFTTRAIVLPPPVPPPAAQSIPRPRPAPHPRAPRRKPVPPPINLDTEEYMR